MSDRHKRAATLLQAAFDLLNKCSKSPYLEDVMIEVVVYDCADRDAVCLMQDIETWLEKENENAPQD